MATTKSRKQDHLDLCINKNVDSIKTNYWDNINLQHCVLPEESFDNLNIETSCLGNTFSAPIFISSMTGGTTDADNINFNLAKLSSTYNIPMGLGSMRIQIENPQLKSFVDLKKQFPKSNLWANLGLIQLNYGAKIKHCLQLLESIESNVLIFHCNALQECLQPEGQTNFKGLIKKLSKLINDLRKNHPNIKIIIKETGCGVDSRSAKYFLECGVDAIDVAGLGGTHWGYIEGLRGNIKLGETFRNWGIPTPDCIEILKNELPSDFPIFASGGIRNGLDIAKAHYLGSQMSGMAKPFLIEANKSYNDLESFYLSLLNTYKIAMFCSSGIEKSGSKNK